MTRTAHWSRPLFERIFHGAHPASDLAQSINQFFHNGGTDCYVVRLAKDAASANLTLRNLADTENVLTVTAKSEGTWGNGIRLIIDYNTPNPDDTFNLHVLYEESGNVIDKEVFTNLSMMPASPNFAPDFVSQSSNLIDLNLHDDMGDPGASDSFINNIANTPAGYSQSRRPFNTDDFDTFLPKLTTILTDGHFEINVNDRGYYDLNLSAIDFDGLTELEDVAGRIAVAINTRLDSGSRVACQWDRIGPEGSTMHVLRITSDSEPYTSVRIRRAQRDDLTSSMMLGLEQGGIEVVRFSNMRPVCNGTMVMGGTAYGDFTDAIDLLSGLPLNAVNELTIAGTPISINVTTEGMAADDLWYQQPDSGTDGVRERLRIIARAVTEEPNVHWRGEVWGYHLVFLKTEGSINDSSTVSLQGSAEEATRTSLADGFIANVRRYSLGDLGTGTYQSQDTDLPPYPGRPGRNGDAPGMEEYIGSELQQTGFHALDSVDLFNLMVLPDDSDVTEEMFLQIIGPAANYCKQHRAFLLIDPPKTWTKNGRPEVRQQTYLIDDLRARLGNAKDHSAVFYPRIQYSNKGLTRSMGAAGTIAGLMARIDSSRGVWKAPAGTEAALNNIMGVEVELTDPENGVLNKLAVNCIRKFPNGFVNWGARTMDGSDDIGSEWKYIPIRRLALFIEESLYRGTKWVVFEPNDEPLWAKIRLNVGVFMARLFRQGAFQGSTPGKAFFVKCDAETTTQADRNLGIVNIVVGFAPLKPAEFVIVKIQQIAGDLI